MRTNKLGTVSDVEVAQSSVHIRDSATANTGQVWPILKWSVYGSGLVIPQVTQPGHYTMKKQPEDCTA